MNPAVPENLGTSAPFGQTSNWPPTYVTVYKNVPAFSLKAGDTVGFDLSGMNDIDIQLEIEMAQATVNGGDVVAGAYTQIAPNTQIPANPKGNAVTGDYELKWTSQAAFNFSGGGLMIRFSDPAGAFATDMDAMGAGVLMNTGGSTDPSNQFVKRAPFDADGLAPFGTEYFTGIPGFQLSIADVPATPAPPSKAKKCKKKRKKRPASARKCKRKKKR